jgi:hypothetical protein
MVAITLEESAMIMEFTMASFNGESVKSCVYHFRVNPCQLVEYFESLKE